MKIGDKVFTTKGDRINGTFGIGTIILFHKWGGFKAAIVQTPDGVKHRNCLLKNLVIVKDKA